MTDFAAGPLVPSTLLVVLASALFAAAASKLLQFEGWVASLANYRIGALRNPLVAKGTPLVEVVVAALLSLDLQPLAALSAAALFGGFSLALAIAYARGARGECNCFGDAFRSSIGILAVGRGGALAAASLALLPLEAQFGRPGTALAPLAFGLGTVVVLLGQLIRVRAIGR